MIIDCNLENLNKIRNVSDIIIYDDVSTIDFDAEEADDDYGEPDLTEEKLKVNKYKLEPEGVQAVIDFLRCCSNISTTRSDKNTNFMKKYKLTAKDCLEIIHNLKVSDYYANTRDFNPGFGGNNLIIFKPKNIELANGKKLKNIVLYIKIDLDETTGDTIVAVSMHEATWQNKLPYINGDFEGIVEDYYEYENYNDLIYDFLNELVEEK